MSSALRKIKRSSLSILDTPSKWSKEIRPPYFAREAFQARLNLRAGFNVDNKPVLLLRWAPEVYKPEMFGVSMPRYWVSRVKDGEDWIYTCVPRWVIERRLEKGSYADSWNKSRYIRDVDSPPCCLDCGYQGDNGWNIELDDTNSCLKCRSKNLGGSRVIDKGPPANDYYIPTWTCAEHEAVNPVTERPFCCDRQWQKDRGTCWGKFRAPNDYDLQCVSAAVGRRENEPFFDPYAPLSPSDLEVIEASSGVQMERMLEAQYEREKDILGDQKIFSDTNVVPFDIGASYAKRIIIP